MKLEFPYTRTTGPVVGAFLTGLRDGRIVGNRCGDRVLCPTARVRPRHRRPACEPDFVEVGPGGVVRSWTWVAEPTPKHPFDRPFAFAQILLDGADTTMVHAVDARDDRDDVDRHAGGRTVPRRAGRCGDRRLLRAGSRCQGPGHHRGRASR